MRKVSVKNTVSAKERIYVCHTYYHVYVACLKELYLPEEKQGKATLVLSTMSNDFGNLKERAQKCGLFEAVYLFEEKEDVYFPQLQKYHTDSGNIIINMLARIKYTKMLGKLQKPYIPVDFKEYKDIYVFCDSDPIGYYLNYKKIYYHALEDGLNCIQYYDTAIYDNRGHFALQQKLDHGETDKILILSEPLCDLDIRKKIFSDIIKEYGEIDGRKGLVLIKPHPRDVLDYAKEFSEHIVSLGKDFMDRYEAPELHRQDEMI